MCGRGSAGASMMRVLVVIVNYRTGGLVVDCLRSLEGEVAGEGWRADVVVVDNCSGDGSLEAIRGEVESKGWGAWVRVTAAERNGGFAYGNNVGIREGLARGERPSYVLLLNPDTVVRPGAIKALVEFMERTPRAGIAGSRLEDPDGSVQVSAFRFPGVLSELESGLRIGMVSRLLSRWRASPPARGEEHETDWVAGASMIVRMEVFEEVGGLDERYFMYFEEVDFCLRARRAGWACWYVPGSRVVHLVGQASGIRGGEEKPKRRPAYWFESRRRFFVTNYGKVRAALADVAWASGFALWRVRRWALRKPDRDPLNLLGDFVRQSVLFKGFRT